MQLITNLLAQASNFESIQWLSCAGTNQPQLLNQHFNVRVAGCHFTVLQFLFGWQNWNFLNSWERFGCFRLVEGMQIKLYKKVGKVKFPLSFRFWAGFPVQVLATQRTVNARCGLSPSILGAGAATRERFINTSFKSTKIPSNLAGQCHQNL